CPVAMLVVHAARDPASTTANPARPSARMFMIKSPCGQAHYPSRVPDPRQNTISPAAHPADAGAWSETDLADPHRHANKAAKVRAMFAAIAPAYDLNNRLHSLGRD